MRNEQSEVYGSISRYDIVCLTLDANGIDMAGLLQHGPDQDNVTKNFRYLKWRNPEPYKAILGLGFPLHRPYIQLI